MISHVRGSLAEKAPTHAVVDVHGVGYRLAISLHTFERLPETGAAVTLLTHTYVREDRLELFGFADAAEREMFQLLIGVSGIGPVSAQTILSGLSLGDLQRAIYMGRTDELTAVRGVGPKTAARLVVELKDKVRLSADLREEAEPVEGDPVAAEALLALKALGFAPAAARRAVSAARKRAGGVDSVQELIKQALRER